VSVTTYTVYLRSQGDAEPLLRTLGAIDEIEKALLDHCSEFAPNPLYKPELLKKRLVQFGWIREPRVPAYDAEIEANLPRNINERYDALKFFDRPDGSQVGVAIEIEGWEINNDLLKFRRGVNRGQIEAGVLIQPDPDVVDYCFDHMRLLHEPLFGNIPLLFVSPRGPGLNEPKPFTKKNYAAYLMPTSSATVAADSQSQR
jgi:hypothetical protein